MKLNNNQQAFLELVRAGLWEKDACLLQYGNIDFQEVYRLAQEQSVVGLVAAGKPCRKRRVVWNNVIGGKKYGRKRF